MVNNAQIILNVSLLSLPCQLPRKKMEKSTALSKFLNWSGVCMRWGGVGGAGRIARYSLQPAPVHICGRENYCMCTFHTSPQTQVGNDLDILLICKNWIMKGVKNCMYSKYLCKIKMLKDSSRNSYVLIFFFTSYVKQKATRLCKVVFWPVGLCFRFLHFGLNY